MNMPIFSKFVNAEWKRRLYNAVDWNYAKEFYSCCYLLALFLNQNMAPVTSFSQNLVT